MRTMGERLLSARYVALGFSVALLASTLFLTVLAFWEWEGERWRFAEEYCAEQSLIGDGSCEYRIENEWGGWYYDIPFFFTDGPEMLDGYSTDQFFLLDGPLLWLGYFALAFVLSVGVCARGYRDIQMFEAQRKKQKEEMAIIPMLALDPQCVIEGRARLPSPIEDIEPTRVEAWCVHAARAVALPTLLLTLVAVLYEILDGGNLVSYRINIEGIDIGRQVEIVYTLLLLLFGITHLLGTLNLISYFQTAVCSDRPSMLPEAMLPLASSAPLSTVDTEETPAPSDEPANMDAVLKMLELEMERARLESQRLQKELEAVNQQVVVLTTELEEKTVELEDMRQVKKTMETVVEERSDSGGKTLTMADSVLVGDALFGSTKIDSQIINDPLAIARAAIDAYREGKKDADDA